MDMPRRGRVRRLVVLSCVAVILGIACFGTLALLHSPRLKADSPSPSTSPSAAPSWLQAIALGALQANTTTSNSASVSVQWTLTTWGQYWQLVPFDAQDASVAAQPGATNPS